ncbi:MAG: ribosomal protein S18-alanine N-acetyltransferase [Chloroflexia bacterium]|jgi:ribosomal-protein-alanine N-acetyltransferase|nr:ribosomal protein S18-alanine N-acetyltransferase [Chloroflexia bacterium]
MALADVAEVSRIEQRCFTNPWPPAAYRRELRAPEQNAYFVLRRLNAPSGEATYLPDEHASGEHHESQVASQTAGRGRLPPRLSHPLRALGWRHETNGQGASELIGFAGMWIVFDEAHITTIGVDPAYRGRGLGELLLVALFADAIRRGAASLTLEVRVSNEAAQNLYLKYGFTIHGTRHRYYSDNHEDAHIMWSESLRDPDYQIRVGKLATQLLDRLELPTLPALELLLAAIANVSEPVTNVP